MISLRVVTRFYDADQLLQSDRETKKIRLSMNADFASLRLQYSAATSKMPLSRIDPFNFIRSPSPCTGLNCVREKAFFSFSSFAVLRDFNSLSRDSFP